MRRSFSPEERSQALRLYAEVGPSEAARRTGIGRSTITSWATRQGIAADAPDRIARAGEVAKAHRDLRKAELAEKLLEDAHRLREQLWAPAQVHHWGTTSEREGGVVTTSTEFMEQEIAEPTFGDKRSILQALAVAVDKSMALAGEVVGKTGVEVTGRGGGPLALDVVFDLDLGDAENEDATTS